MTFSVLMYTLMAAAVAALLAAYVVETFASPVVAMRPIRLGLTPSRHGRVRAPARWDCHGPPRSAAAPPRVNPNRLTSGHDRRSGCQRRNGAHH